MDGFSVEILRPSGNMIILGKVPIPWRVCVRLCSNDVAVKRVFYGDNNSDVNVYIRELILSNKDRNLQILLTG